MTRRASMRRRWDCWAERRRGCWPPDALVIAEHSAKTGSRTIRMPQANTMLQQGDAALSFYATAKTEGDNG